MHSQTNIIEKSSICIIQYKIKRTVQAKYFEYGLHTHIFTYFKATLSTITEYSFQSQLEVFIFSSNSLSLFEKHYS